jgi:hypothetical protein
VTLANIGKTNSSGVVKIYGINGRQVASRPITELKEAWQRPLRW